MKKKLLSLSIAALVFFSVSALYADTKAVEKKSSYGEVLKEAGIIAGDAKGNLNAGSVLKREELVVIINRLYRDFRVPKGMPVQPTTDYATFTPPQKPSFSDVPTSHWAYKDVEFAYAKGLTTGVGGGKFGIGQNVNASQLALFLLRDMGYDKSIKSENISYENAYYLASRILNIEAYRVKDPMKTIIRADVFEMVYDALMAPLDDYSLFIGTVFYGPEEIDSVPRDMLLANFGKLKNDIEPVYNKFDVEKQLYEDNKDVFNGILELKKSDLTELFDLSIDDGLKPTLYSLNYKFDPITDHISSPFVLVSMKNDHNTFVSVLNEFSKEKFTKISAEKLKSKVGKYYSLRTNTWLYTVDDDYILSTLSYRDNYYHIDYEKNEVLSISSEILTYGASSNPSQKLSYPILSIMSNEAGNRFVVVYSITSSEKVKKHFFIAFEYDEKTNMTLKGVSGDNYGFGVY